MLAPTLMCKRLGFTGSDSQIIEKAFKADPILLRACYSASAMWTANAGTISPSVDTLDGKVQFTAANLNNKFHRSLEPVTTTALLPCLTMSVTLAIIHTT